MTVTEIRQLMDESKALTKQILEAVKEYAQTTQKELAKD